MSTQPATTFRKGHADVLNSRIESQASRLSADDYLKSVMRINERRFYVASSSRPSMLREVLIRENGSMTCSCPARKTCVHIRAVEAFLAPIELKIAEPVIEEPCRCCGCRPVDPNPFGCTRRASASDWQAVNATAA